MKTIVVSGGFDPLHAGHLDLFRWAAREVDGRLVVIVESDSWVAKKRSVLMPQAYRAKLIKNLKCVSSVFCNWREDGDCSDLLNIIRPAVYVVGPDHADRGFPEAETCRQLGIEVRVANLSKDVSSSDLIARVQWKNPIPMVAAVITKRDTNAVLLSDRSDGKGWELIGGFVETNETLEEAIFREVKEETRCDVSWGYPHFLYSMAGTYYDGRGIIVSAFRCNIKGEDPRPTAECKGFRWADGLPRPEEFSHEVDYQILERWHKGV